MQFFTVSKKLVRHSWREPIYGALLDWLRHWYSRILLATFFAGVFACLWGWRNGNDIDGAIRSFFPALGISNLVIGMYAFVQRRIELYDDYLVVVQGRGGDRYRYSDIGVIVVEANKKHPFLVIRLKSGKATQLFLSSDLPLSTICHFFLERQIEIIHVNNNPMDHIKCEQS